MLVFTRKEDETVVIGQDIHVTVMTIGEDIVQLRLSFPLKPENLYIEMWTGEGEEFSIGAHIIGKIVAIGSARVRIAIDADPAVPVDRKEIRELKLRDTSPEGPARRRLRPSAPGQCSRAHAPAC